MAIQVEREKPKKPVEQDDKEQIQKLQQEVDGLKLVIDDLILNGGGGL